MAIAPLAVILSEMNSTSAKSHITSRQSSDNSREFDRSLFLAVLFLLGLGLVQVYSSSFIFAIESFNDGLFFVKKQALFAVMTLVVLLVTAHLPWAWASRIATFLWGAAVIGVALTLVPGLGVKVGGAVRWLNIGGGWRFEPSELLKYTYPIVLAHIFSRSSEFRHHFDWRCGALWVLALLPLALLLKQPDFGSVAIISIMIFAMLFARGLKWRYVAALAGLIAVTFYFLVMREEYRRARIAAFLDPWSDPAQKGFQVIQSMLGFFSGGLTGVGLGQGQGKLFFLPEAHTDFTLSVLGEELGFVGIFITLTVFGFVMLRGFQISARSRDPFEQVLSLGLTLIFAFTSLLNAGVALGLLPTKGLGMPFLSYGGSALVATGFALGLLLNMDRHSRSN